MKKISKKYIYAVAALFLIATVVLASALISKSVKNFFVAGDANIVIYENGEAKSETAEMTLKIENGTTYTADKEVTIKNEDGSNPVPVYLRVMIFPKFDTNETLQTGITDEGLPAVISGNTYKVGDVTFTFDDEWEKYWYYNSKDNCFYYIGLNENADSIATTGLLNIDAQTEPLLSKVSIEKSVYDSTYLSRGTELKVVVLADAIQAVGTAVENRWGIDKLSSSDRLRPDIPSGSAISLTSLEEETTSNTTVSPAAIVISEYDKRLITNMITRVSATVTYILEGGSDDGEEIDSNEEAVEMNEAAEEAEAVETAEAEEYEEAAD